jgi:hypothetical protein
MTRPAPAPAIPRARPAGRPLGWAAAGTARPAAERQALRCAMLRSGMTCEHIAAAMMRTYGLRPRPAWRQANGWSLTTAADRINNARADAGLEMTMTGPHLSEYENVRHEAPCNRVEVGDLRRRAVAAAW